MEYIIMIKRILISASLLLAAPAMAIVDTEWDFAQAHNAGNATVDSSNAGNIFTVNNSAGDEISITGWADTGIGGTTNNVIESGKLAYSTGYGLTLQNRLETSGSPDHAIDSFNDNFDMVLVSFDALINLTEFSIDWRREGTSYTQADITVAAYEGTDTISTLAGVDKWDAIAAPGSGWTTVGSYGNVDSGDDIAYQAVNTTIESKYWLIGAYNPIFTGGEDASNASSWNPDLADAFKLASVKGAYVIDDTPPGGGTSIPEPASLFLFATALFGLLSTKRGNAKV
jgi:hypothetical protein